MDVRSEDGRDETAEPEDGYAGAATHPDWRTDYPGFVPWFISAVFP
jgi:hypothetical protein